MQPFRVLYSDPTDLVSVGQREIPRVIRVEVFLGARRPTAEVQIEIRRKVPVCTEVQLVSSDAAGASEIRDRDLRAINIDSLIERVVAEQSLQFVEPESVPRITTLDELQIRKNLQAADQRYRDNLTNVRRARAGRPRIPYETLAKVADVYRENVDGRPTEAVQAAFGLSRRTAARYVQLCRSKEHQLLPPTDPGKKKA